MLEKVTVMPSLTPPAQNWVLRASEHAWELPGSGWGPWAERWLRTKVSFLAWQAAGSLLPKQHPPPQVGQGGDEEGELDRAEIEAALLL